MQTLKHTNTRLKTDTQTDTELVDTKHNIITILLKWNNNEKILNSWPANTVGSDWLAVIAGRISLVDHCHVNNEAHESLGRRVSCNEMIQSNTLLVTSLKKWDNLQSP